MSRPWLSVALLLLLPASGIGDEGAPRPPCAPCFGVRVTDPDELPAALATPPALAPGAPLYTLWAVDLRASDTAATAETLRRAGGVPWMAVVLTTPAPLAAHSEALEVELEALAELAATAGERAHFQIEWRPTRGAGPATAPADYAFLLKRASVAIAGAAPRARVMTAALAPEPELLAEIYGEDIGSYVDGVVLAGGEEEALAEAVARLAELDPGRPVVVESLPLPEPPAAALAVAARLAELGIAVTFFELPDLAAGPLAPIKIAAAELAGEVSLDPYTAAEGTGRAWTFVRAGDLSLRLVVVPDPGEDPVVLRLGDASLRRPERVDLATGEARPLPAPRPVSGGIELRLPEPGPVLLLRLERPGIDELEGVAEELVVRGQRPLPVEEILRRLQAFEDAQRRRLGHFRALNTTHLRFQLGAGLETLELTLEGDFFFRQGEGFDWAWQRFYVNGVRWRGRSLPEIPLIQPEKAAALPLDVHLTREYRYRLRGRERVDGRDTWVVDFEPASDPTPGHTLYRGTVWIDREIYARVRSRAVQLGLEGEVVSNEETIDYRPVATGLDREPPVWLPVAVRGQQIWTVLNATTVVERETELRQVEINAPGFEAQRREVMASEATMVRDTERGLRYLVRRGRDGKRVVQEGFRRSRLFAAGGLYYDRALDYPLPLGGVNYFSFDFRDTGSQVNLFFGGVLANATVATPRLLGSRFDAGVDLFAIALAFGSPLYRDGREVPGEKVEIRPARASFSLGRPVGEFARLGLAYRLAHSSFRSADTTADEFTLPGSHFDHGVEASLRFSRRGYRLGAGASLHRRSSWEPWGLPGEAGYDPDHRTYARWQITAAKTWHLPRFRRLGLEANLLGGSDLDRFSKYQFGFFGPTRVRGYATNLVRAERVEALHGSYGLEIGELFRLAFAADAAWATDREGGLDRELLAGAGITGGFIGPWETLVQLDVGVPVAGPADGFVAHLVLLKLLR